MIIVNHLIALLATLAFIGVVQATSIVSLPAQRTLSNVTGYLGQYIVPVNYTIRFDIRPLGTISQFGNIFHFTQENYNYNRPGSRMPALSFRPNSTVLRLEIATTNDTVIIEDFDALTPNQVTSVRIHVFGTRVQVAFNNIGRDFFILTPRMSGEAWMYLASDFMYAANAEVSNFVFETFSAQDSRDIVAQRTITKGWYHGVIDVPYNYSLSFEVNPSAAVIGDWGAILQFTKENYDYRLPGSRMPGVFFKPNTTELRVEVGGNVTANLGFDFPALPTGVNTIVVITCFGNRVSVSLNGVIWSYYTSEARHSGPAHLWVSPLWDSAALATISNINIISITSEAATNLALERSVVKGWYVGTMTVPNNYVLTFSVKPSAVVTGWANLFHFTKEPMDYNLPGSRMPAVYFNSSLRPRIEIGGNVTASLGIPEQDLPTLAANVFTQIEITAVGNRVQTKIGNNFERDDFFDEDRVSGLAHLFMSNPFENVLPAAANISGFSINSIATSQLRDLAPQRELVKSWYHGIVTVPENFSLAFTIQPRGLVAGWANILHYTQLRQNYNGPGSRMPAIYFKPNTTELRIEFGGVYTPNFGYDFPALVMNNAVQVRIHAWGRNYQVSIGTVVYEFYNDEPRVFGQAHLYVSNPWVSAANALISGISMNATTNRPITNTLHILESATQHLERHDYTTSRRITSPFYIGEISLPEHYNLTFRITPHAIMNVTTNIVHFSRENFYNENAGSNMPAVFFRANTTQLMVVIGGNESSWIAYETDPLPLATTHTIRILAVGDRVQVEVNNVGADFFPPEPRLSGRAHMYVSSPWMPAANASISDITLNNATSYFARDLIASRALTRNWYYAPTGSANWSITENYTLEFNLTINGRVPGWASIIQFTRERDINYNFVGTRMPAVWLRPNTTALRVEVGGNRTANRGFDFPDLPTGTMISVRIVCVGNNTEVFISPNPNSVPVGITRYEFWSFEPRPFGSTNMWAANPWVTPANATIRDIRLLNNTASLSTHDLIAARQISSPWFAGRFNVPADYSLSFTIRPLGIVPGWANILHYTQNNWNYNAPGSRMPAIYFRSNSTVMRIEVGGNATAALGYDSPALPLNQDTAVNITCVGGRISIQFNTTIVDFFTNETRPSGPANLYVSDPWTTAANAQISNIVMIPVTQHPVRNLIPERPIIRGYYGGFVNVPENYSLEFEVRPTELIADWTNIFIFSQERRNYNSGGSRMPAVWFRPNSTILRIEPGGNVTGGVGFDLPPIQLNQWSIVTLRCFANRTQVRLNGVDYDWFSPEPRVFGNAHLYVSSPSATRSWNTFSWNFQSNVAIRNFTLPQPIFNPETRSLSAARTLTRSWYHSLVFVPENYTLSFIIYPTGTSPHWTNILHFTRENRDYNTPGSRMPAIYFKPGTTQLRIEFGTTEHADYGIDLDTLQHNQFSTIQIQVNGNISEISINNMIRHKYFTEPRLTGHAHFYVSNPWNEPAIASISQIVMTDFTSTQTILQKRNEKLLDIPEEIHLSSRFAKRTEVDSNYAVAVSLGGAGVFCTAALILFFKRRRASVDATSA